MMGGKTQNRKILSIELFTSAIWEKENFVLTVHTHQLPEYQCL